jgi:hypothetical protein
VKDVRQLVRGNEPEPAVEEQQAVIAGGRGGEDHDPVCGKDGGEAVRGVDVVGEGDVHDAARRVQLRGQHAVGPLCLAGLRQRGRAIGEPKVDAEVGRVEGAPGAGGVHLSFRWDGEAQQKENADCGLRIAEWKWKVEPPA